MVYCVVCELYLNKRVLFFFKQENTNHNDQSMETNTEWTQILELGENDAKKVIKATLHMLKKLSRDMEDI